MDPICHSIKFGRGGERGAAPQERDCNESESDAIGGCPEDGLFHGISFRLKGKESNPGGRAAKRNLSREPLLR
jgi:hypothetical protein